MNIYMAPLEGITDHIWRNAHSDKYKSVDKYFTPFIVPMQEKIIKHRDLRDILPGNNTNINVVPQILTSDASLFLETAGIIEELGYNEVDLNLGCPSGTVTAKGKGAGFLAYPDKLNAFLEQIFCGSNIKISIKTRIGVHDTDEFPAIMEIFNAYPISELIIHPRLLSDKYRGLPHMECFDLAYEICKCPLVYNGNIFTVSSYKDIADKYPDLKGIMLGRGIVAEPGLADRCKGITTSEKQLRAFHDEVFEGRCRILSGDKNVLYHVKEMWFYLNHSFYDMDKPMKKLRKLSKVSEYGPWVDTVFDKGLWNPEKGFTPPL